MNRRLLLAAAMLVPFAAQAAASTPVVPPPAYSNPLMSHPLKGCGEVTDITGDANPVLVGPVTTGQDSAVDLTGVSMRTTYTTIDAFVAVSGLTRNTNSVVWSRYDIVVSFVANGKTVVLDASQDRPTTGTVGGTAAGLLKPSATFDFVHSGVLFSIDRVGLGMSVGSALPDGSTYLTAIQASSSVTSLLDLITTPVDTATTGARTYKVGDVTCFLPPAGTISLVMADSGQYTDTVRITATFRDAAGKPAAREQLDAYLSSATPGASEFTDDNGVAVLDLPLTWLGEFVAVAFAGDTEIGQTVSGMPFTVTAERTRLTATPGRGTVKATLLDDDGDPVAGAPITFIEGRRTFVLYTGTSGATIYKTARGTLVKVSYAGKRGYYLAASSASARAL